MALNSLYGMIGKAPTPTVDDGMGGNMAPNQMPGQSPTQTTGDPNDLMQMLQPFLDKSGTAGQGQRNQADQYRQQSRDASQAAYDIKAPNSTAPAFRTADAIGLGLLALVSGRHFDKAFMGYMGAKNQKAEADEQAALQAFGMRQKSMLSQAQNFAGMADDADRRAAQEQDQAQRQFGTMATALVNRINNQNTNDTGLKKTDATIKSKEKIAGLTESGRWARMAYKTEADRDKQKARDFAAMAKMTPQGRYQWVKSNDGTEEEALAYGNASPSDLLNLARASKIPYEINKLKADVRRTNSGIKLDEARAKQIVEATRFIGPSFDLKRQQLALNVENVHNLMRVRKAGIALREDQIEKGASAMNQARRSITYLQSLAQKEYGKLLDAGDLTDEQEARKLELEDAIDQNQAIIDGLNEAQGLIPELDPSQVNQLFGGMLGEIPPIRGNIEGLGQPPGVQAPSGGMGALRGNLGDLAREAQSAAAVSRERGGGKGRNAVAPANPNVRVTAVRRGKGNK